MLALRIILVAIALGAFACDCDKTKKRSASASTTWTSTSARLVTRWGPPKGLRIVAGDQRAEVTLGDLAALASVGKRKPPVYSLRRIVRGKLGEDWRVTRLVAADGASVHIESKEWATAEQVPVLTTDPQGHWTFYWYGESGPERGLGLRKVAVIYAAID